MNTSQMPVHPFTGLTAVYVNSRGRAFYPIAGGSGDGDGGQGSDAAGQNGDQAAGDGSQGGQQASGGTSGQADGQQAQDGQQQGQQAEWDGKIESLPEGAQKIIRELRQEAGDERVATKTLAAIQKALNPEAGDEEKVDPAKLASDLTTERTAHTNLQREHQVLLAALDAGADHTALLDSRSFLTKVAALDPAADDFATKVKAAVDTAVTENPKLKAGRAPGASSVDHPGGPGNNGAPRTPKPLSDAVTGHYGG